MFTVEVYKSAERDHGFRIIDESGQVVREQDFAPFAEGFRPMKKAKAKHYADLIVDELEKAPKPGPAPGMEPPDGEDG